ncbi:hypothetical protein PVAP13_8KG398415 [Panicum virgatum]|uniref:Uncharacterized protein n=1 Tax=Panicum virgatum TaxID=38727 RepID=A0A8T0PUD0_PANVG|nr:hypothetical protein PVAP13_8KG398415 [Panicum virgatum]KAG2564080.1 hypothetical protein PVAP13_8KG398415 [Panicum virgatum]
MHVYHITSLLTYDATAGSWWYVTLRDLCCQLCHLPRIFSENGSCGQLILTCSSLSHHLPKSKSKRAFLKLDCINSYILFFFECLLLVLCSLFSASLSLIVCNYCIQKENCVCAG